tara:strand:+ start:1192 stop:2127 length:936 start_codon:yes stop_codon:yes gene_type:complete
MKYSFYCLPLKQNVKAKVTGIVKKKSYGIKGEYKHKGKTYNCHKVCSKAEAERVSKESSIDITYPDLQEAKASETVTEVVDAPVAVENADGVEEVAMLGDDTFQPDGNGRVIGSNSASMVTATPGTDAVININATPFNGEDDDDNMGPMSMASEEKKNCGCGQDPCVTYGAECGSKRAEIEMDIKEDIPDNYETFTVSKDLYRRLTAHSDWKDMVNEGQVKIYREDDGIHISAGGPFADDLLDMIIEAQEFPSMGEDGYLDDRFTQDFNSENKSLRRNAIVATGIGTLGLIAAVMLLNRFAKQQDEEPSED